MIIPAAPGTTVDTGTATYSVFAWQETEDGVVGLVAGSDDAALIPARGLRGFEGYTGPNVTSLMSAVGWVAVYADSYSDLPDATFTVPLVAWGLCDGFPVGFVTGEDGDPRLEPVTRGAFIRYQQDS